MAAFTRDGWINLEMISVGINLSNGILVSGLATEGTTLLRVVSDRAVAIADLIAMRGARYQLINTPILISIALY